MHLREGVRLALLQIRQEKLKSAFSLVGVVLGVTFLVLVVSVVEGMDRYVTEDLAAGIYGVNTLQVRRAPAIQVERTGDEARARRPRLTHEEAATIRRGLSVPARVGVESGLSAEVRTDEGLRAQGVQVQAVSEEMLAIRGLEIAHGRVFAPREAERGVPVAVLGSRVAEALFPPGEALGQRVRIRGQPYRVVGVLEERGTLLGVTQDNVVLVPALSPVVRFLPDRRGVGTISVQVLAAGDLGRAAHDAEAALRLHRGLRPGEPNDFVIETADESLAFWDRIALVLFLALPGLVGVSLVVGGIVIMNIMLMSVIERTREIGVRMAIGARRRDIVQQFLVEAATLSGVGAVLGIVLGLALAGAVRSLSPLPAAVAPHWLLLGLALGVAAGVGAGVYPALRASRMDPVEALRHE